MNKNIFISKANSIGNNSGVWYFLGCLLSFGMGQILGSIPFMILVILNGDLSTMDTKAMLDPETFDIDKNLFLLTVLLPFVLGSILLWAYVKIVHKKPFKLLITPFQKIKWNYLFGSAGIWFAIMLITELIGYFSDPTNYEVRFEAGSFIPLLIISLTVLFVQTSFEELLFRGYGLQWIGRYFKSAWWPLIITSVVFGLVHSFNPEMTEYGPSVMIMYISMGFVMGYVTLMSRSLELALGMHFANNFFSAVLFNFDESALNTDSLFRIVNMEVGTQQHILSIGTLLIFVIIVKFVFKLDFNIDRSTPIKEDNEVA